MSMSGMTLEQILAEANAHMRAGRNQQGIDAFRRAIALSPQHAQIHLLLAQALHSAGQFDQAIDSYRRTLELQPGLLQAYFELSVAYREAHRFNEAIEILQRLVNLSPAHHQVWNDLAILLQMQGRSDEALAAHQRAIALGPRSATNWLNLGNFFYKQRRCDDAIQAFRQAISLQPDFLEAWANLANALRASGRLNQALEASKRSLQIKPDSPIALDVRANIFMDRGEIDRVIPIFKQALALDPSDPSRHYNLGMTLLLSGEFEQGWRECEWRMRVEPRISKRPKFAKPAWDGRSNISDKRLVLYSEQGIGDAVQLFRYLPRIPQLGAKIILRVPPEVAPLAQRCEGIDKVDAVTCLAEPADYDLHYSLLSLPFYFGTTLETIPHDVPYLRTDPEKVSLWNKRLSDFPRPRVGLVWAGSPEHLNNDRRSMALSLFAPLAELRDVTFVTLQKGLPAEQTKSPPPGLSLLDFTSELNDFADTADLIGALDLVICVDTAVAHLAGAMGKPVWVLLPFVPDWRWMTHRTDSPWYPTMRLFRQTALGDWQTPLAEVVAALHKFQTP